MLLTLHYERDGLTRSALWILILLTAGTAGHSLAHRSWFKTRRSERGVEAKESGELDPLHQTETESLDVGGWREPKGPTAAAESDCEDVPVTRKAKNRLGRDTATTDFAAPEATPDGSDQPAIGRGGALAGHRHRVVVSTDVGGTDPDDFQSMVHLLVYADVLEIEGLVASPYGPGGKQHILDVIDCYETDYANLKTYSGSYPSPDALRGLTKQGETERAPYAGVRRSTEGSRWIVHRARRKDPRPLHVLVWGGIEDLAQALHDAPDILPTLRVYWIGGPNKKWSPDAFQYLVDHFPTLWMIESNATYRGWFTGGDQSGEWGNKAFVSRHIAGKGALGRFFVSKKSDLKMGDTPSVGWLLEGTPEDPSRPGWGGRFMKAPERPFLRFKRITTRDDRIEAFAILEFALPMGANAPDKPEAFLVVENQMLVGHPANDGTMRFRFCPKAAKTYAFGVRSNVPGLDGRKGEVTAVPERPDQVMRGSDRYPNWWVDDPSPELSEAGHIGAKTVSRWRVDFLRDFAARMARCERPKP